MIALGVFALVIVLGEWGQAQAQDPKAPYASMAPLDSFKVPQINTTQFSTGRGPLGPHIQPI
jgi:hypothetical protein